jgi:hypothetical protein
MPNVHQTQFGLYFHIVIFIAQFSNYMICGFHGGGYEEWRLLGCYAVWLL